MTQDTVLILASSPTTPSHPLHSDHTGLFAHAPSFPRAFAHVAPPWPSLPQVVLLLLPLLHSGLCSDVICTESLSPIPNLESQVLYFLPPCCQIEFSRRKQAQRWSWDSRGLRGIDSVQRREQKQGWAEEGVDCDAGISGASIAHQKSPGAKMTCR